MQKSMKNVTNTFELINSTKAIRHDPTVEVPTLPFPHPTSR